MKEIDMQQLFDSLSDQMIKIINNEKVVLVKKNNEVSIYLKENKNKIFQIYKSKKNKLEIVLVLLFYKELLPCGFHEYQIYVEKNNEKYYIKNNEATNLKMISDQECQNVNEVSEFLIKFLNNRLQLL